MVDPLTATGVGALVLTEGIKFVYTQAGELIKWWRERKASREGASEKADAGGPVLAPPKDLLAGAPEAVAPDDSRLDELGPRLNDVRRSLTDYVEGIVPVEPGDVEPWNHFDEVRRIVEVVYGQRITLKGEEREASGPLVVGEVDVKDLLGRAAGISADEIAGGEVRGTGRADVVREGAHLAGVEAKTIGSPGRRLP